MAPVNNYLGESARTPALSDRIEGDGSRPAHVRRYPSDRSITQFLEARRSREVVDHADPRSEVRELIVRRERDKGDSTGDPSLRAFLKRRVCEDSARYYEVMVGAGERAGAAEVAASLAGLDPADAYPALIAAAKRAGDPGAAEALAEEDGKITTPGGAAGSGRSWPSGR